MRESFFLWLTAGNSYTTESNLTKDALPWKEISIPQVVGLQFDVVLWKIVPWCVSSGPHWQEYAFWRRIHSLLNIFGRARASPRSLVTALLILTLCSSLYTTFMTIGSSLMKCVTALTAHIENFGLLEREWEGWTQMAAFLYCLDRMLIKLHSIKL